MEPRGTMQVIPQPIVDRLVCPECSPQVEERQGGQGIGWSAGHVHPMRDGSLDCFAWSSFGGSTDRTVESFGFEWNNFDDVREEDAGFADGSSAVCAKARNLADFDNVLVVKSDLRTAPFAAERFDFIASLGVPHHLDNPRAGFERLIRQLPPGGRVLLYLYSRPPQAGLRATALAAAALRRLITCMPYRRLRMLTTPTAALYVAVVVPAEVGDRFSVGALRRLPMDAHRGKPFRSLVLDTFDRLSAPVEHRYVWSELEPWFADAGLVVEADRDETGWFVLVSKPETGAEA
ncbi:MAG: methyltransferase domain-containing protein [Acidimicrobiales bacterium]